MAEYGFVYCLSNESMPGIYKIGFTRGSPSLRAKQLSAPTSVPTPFDVEWYAESEGADVLEAELHKALGRFRVSESREFFKVCPIAIYELLDGRHLTDWLSPEYLFRVHEKRQFMEGKSDGQNQDG